MKSWEIRGLRLRPDFEIFCEGNSPRAYFQAENFKRWSSIMAQKFSKTSFMMGITSSSETSARVNGEPSLAHQVR